MTAQKKNHRPGKTFLVVFCSLLLLIGLVLLGGRLWFRLPVSDYYAASEAAFAIPGLSEGFVPQGLALDEEAGVYLVGGYMKKAGEASPVYVVDRRTGELKARTSLTEPDGSAFTGHAGGLAVSGDNVLIAGSEGGCVDIFDREAILAAGDGFPVQRLGQLYTRLSESDPLGVAFVDVSMDDEGDLLTVGEFYREPQYPTAESHKFTTPSGERLQALAVTYRIRIWLSASWGIGFSHIYAWDLESLQPFDTISVDGQSIPLYALESCTRAVDYKLPPMSEEIVFSGEKLLTMCESASRKYYFGQLTGGQWCYATDLSRLAAR